MERVENYCRLLGLNPLNPSAYNDDAIRKRIESRRTKWKNDANNKQNDTQQRFNCNKLLDQIGDIERVMFDPTLRRKEFSDAEKELRGQSDIIKQNCVILDDGTPVVLRKALETFVKRLRWDDVKASDIVKITGVTEKSPADPVDNKVKNAYKALVSVGASTPIEMLNDLITNPDLQISCSTLSEGSSDAQIREAFTLCENRVNSVRVDVFRNQDPYVQTMRTVKLVINENNTKKLIEYGRCNKALDKVMNTIVSENLFEHDPITRKYIDELLNCYLTDDIDRRMAIKILQVFCFNKSIPANFSDSESSMVRCQNCRNMVQVGRDTAFCPICGVSFMQTCPRCGTVQQSSNKMCIGCGFNFKDGLKEASGIAMNIKMNIQRGRIAVAASDLEKLEDRFPGYNQIDSIKASLTKVREAIDAQRRYILQCYSENKFYETKSSIEMLNEKYSDILSDDVELGSKYKDSVNHFNTAENSYKKAQVSDTKARKIEFYIAAIQTCPDHPQAKAKLMENPPEGPWNIGVMTDNGNVSLTYEPPAETDGVTYCIYRSIDSIPIVSEDTKPLATVPGTSYVDRTALPGTEYYYSVYSKRWGVLSRNAANIGPVFMLQEVEDVCIDPITGGLRITYTKPRGASRVRVWRSRGDSGKEIPLNGATAYDDIGLEGGVEYTYLFIAEYSIKGRTERTEGLRYVKSTIEFPDPVKDMEIRWNKVDGTYSARWGTPYPVTLYSSKKRLNIDGNLQNMSDIESWMTRINPLEEYSNGIKFSIEDGAVHYLYPVIQKETVGVVGDKIMVANLKPFRDVEYRISGKDCIVTMVWPAKAVNAKIRIMNSGNVKDADAETLYISAEQYRGEKQIRIPMGRCRSRILTLYAEYEIDGIRRESRGMTIEVHSGDSSKVRYTAKKDRTGIAVSIDAGTARELPSMSLVRTVEGIPLKRTDGEIVWKSGGPVTLQGGKTVIMMDKVNPKDMEHCRLFFDEDGSYYDFRFIHPVYREERR